MSDIDVDYYRAEGPAKKLLADYFEQKEKAYADANALAQEFGAVCCVATRRCNGFQFPEGTGPQAGLRNHKGDPKNWFYPNLRTKVGQEIEERLKAITFPSSADLTVALMGKADFVPSPRGNGAVVLLGPTEMRRVGDAFILTMEAGAPKPKGCVPIKGSEYHRLIETHEWSKEKEAEHKNVDTAIEHYCTYGTKFRSISRDLHKGVVIIHPKSRRRSPLKEETLAAEVAEFIGWYAVTIYPTLPPTVGFAGFDCLNFTVEYEK